MMNRVFDPENGLFQTLGKLVDVVGLSLLWLLCSMPVFTLGPATAALYYAVVKCVRRDEEKTYLNFFRGFRDNFKVGAIISLMAAAAAWALFRGHELLLARALAGDKTAVVLYVAYNVVLLLMVGILCWVFPLLSRFTFGVGGLLLTSFKLALRYLPLTIIAALLVVASVLLSMQYWFPMLVLPVITALLISFLFEWVFKKYIHQEGASGAPAEGEVADAPWYLK